MKRLVAFAMALCMALFTGCTGLNVTKNVEELLSPPKLTQEQTAVVNALEEAEGGTIQLKYPNVGNSSSPLLLADLNADGKEEAVVFYVAPQKGKNARVAILEQQKDGYKVAFEEEGISAEIDSAAIAHFYEGNGRQLVVGYRSASLAQNYLYVYNCVDDQGNLAFQKEEEQPYTRFLVCDMTGDGLDDLVTASTPSELSGGTRISLFGGQSGALAQLSTFDLSERITGCQSLQISTGQPNNTLVIDCTLGVASTGSLALYYASGKLRAYQTLAGEDFLQKTARSSALLQSMDVDEDGVVEIPVLVGTFPGAGNGSRFLRVDWYDTFASTEKADFSGIVDLEYGYFLRLPEDIVDTAAVSYEDGQRNWGLVDTATNQELFDVLMLAKGEKLTGNDDKEYEQLAVSAGYRVYLRIAKLPQGTDKGVLLSGFINLK